jgi:hypothetical protein
MRKMLNVVLHLLSQGFPDSICPEFDTVLPNACSGHLLSEPFIRLRVRSSAPARSLFYCFHQLCPNNTVCIPCTYSGLPFSLFSLSSLCPGFVHRQLSPLFPLAESIVESCRSFRSNPPLAPECWGQICGSTTARKQHWPNRGRLVTRMLDSKR